jgi:Ser/Thr protein kinase RdoA (MazF antagonist)
MQQNDYIHKRQEKMTTPPEVIDSVFADMTGEEMVSKARIYAGEDNEVYLVRTEKEEVILRISRKGPVEFRKESWAMEQCKKAGVPVAAMVSIKDTEHEGAPLSFCIQTKIEGDSLSRGSMDYHDLGEEILKKIIVESGAVLSKIHSVSTDGFGPLDGNGHGSFGNLGEFMGHKLPSPEALEVLSRQTGIGFELLVLVRDFMLRKSKDLDKLDPKLVCRDFSPKHIFVGNDYKITGIIDFGAVYGYSPVYDFAVWDYWMDDLPLEWIKEGYANKALFDEDFEGLLSFFKLYLALYLLNLYQERGNQEGVEQAKAKLSEFWREIRND